MVLDLAVELVVATSNALCEGLEDARGAGAEGAKVLDGEGQEVVAVASAGGAELVDFPGFFEGGGAAGTKSGMLEG